MDKKKPVQKRTTLQKIAYILRPFVVYMLVKTVAMITLALIIRSLPVRGIGAWATWINENLNMASAFINALASLAAVFFVLDDFLREAAVFGEVDIDASVFSQLISFFKNSFFGIKSLLACAALGGVSAICLNIAIALISDFMSQVLRTQGLLGSDKYEAVKQIQYSVPFAAGLVLYVLIAPLVEEIVFRGIIFNRIRHFYSVEKAVAFSALLFGAFHANLPQFIYGACMGAAMAICYERTKCFYAPLLFHMAANAAVFMAAAG